MRRLSNSRELTDIGLNKDGHGTMSSTDTSAGINGRRPGITELPLYHDGELGKKYTGEKDFRKYFAELRGCTIFFYPDKTSDMYTEKLELKDLKRMETDVPRSSTETLVYTLTLLYEEIQLKINGPGAAEEWRGYIMTAAAMKIPSNMHLLPGQVMKMEDMLKNERERTSHLPTSQSSAQVTNSRIPADTPSCFYDVTREEAQRMLEDKPEYGSLIMRPGTDGSGYSITLRQILDRGPEIRHYKVRSTDSGFAIQLDVPLTLPTLDEVVLHFVEKTDYTVKPFVRPQMYDTCIGLCNMRMGLPPKPLQPVESFVSPTEKPLLSSSRAPVVRKQVTNAYELPNEIKKWTKKKF